MGTYHAIDFAMEVVLLYPAALSLLVILPMVHLFHGKIVKRPSLVLPNTRLLRKIIGPAGKSKNVLLGLRHAEIFLVVVSCAEPMIITEKCTIRSSQFMLTCSLVCFLLDVLLRNTIFHRIP